MDKTYQNGGPRISPFPKHRLQLVLTQQHIPIPASPDSINVSTHLLKPGPRSQPSFFPLCPIFHIESFSHCSHLNFQKLSGISPPLSISTVGSKLLPLPALQQPLTGSSTSWSPTVPSTEWSWALRKCKSDHQVLYICDLL